MIFPVDDSTTRSGDGGTTAIVVDDSDTGEFAHNTFYN